jgi:hypothetical protein
MKVKELKKALASVDENIEVAMADEMSVVFAEVVDGVFIISDLTDDMDEPVEYWRADDLLI